MAPLEEGSVLLFALGVVAHQRDRAALVRGAGERGVAQRVAGAVEPRRLAVPDADDAVVAAGIERDGQLGAHHRGGRQLFVHALLEHHPEAVGFGELGSGDDIAVEPRQRTTGIAGDVGGGLQPGTTICT